MGNRLSNIIGSGYIPARPSPLSRSFKRWCERLIDYRLEETPLTYSDQVNIYVSRDGDDFLNNGLTIDSPIQSLTSANSLINTTGLVNKIRINLRRGDTFPHANGNTIGLSGIGVNNLVITSYDDNGARATGLPPRITSFYNISNLSASNSGWVAGPSGSWHIGIGANYRPIYWAKQDDTHLSSRTPNVLVEVTGLADLYRVTGSWYFQTSTNLLHMHFYNNANPSGAGITPQATYCDVDNIYVARSDNVRIEDIIVEGGGIGPADAGYGVKVQCSGVQSVVLKGIGSYYVGNHGIGVLDSSANTSGFIATFVNCYGGLMRPATNGETFFIAYANQGAHEYIFYRNSGIFGTMRGSGAQTHTARGQNIYAHSAGESNQPSFGLAMQNATVLSGSYLSIPFAEVTTLQDFNTIPACSGGNVNAVSGFIVDEVYDWGNNDSSNGQYLNLGAVCVINPRFKFNLKDSTAPEVHNINSAAVQLQQYWINPRIGVVLWTGTSNFSSPALFNTTRNNVIFNIDIYHGQIDWFVMSGAVATGIAGTTWDRSKGIYYTGLVGNSGYSPGAVTHNIRSYNTLQQTFTSGVAIRSSINLPNKPPGTGIGGQGVYFSAFGGQSHNAYYGFPSGDINTLVNNTGYFFGGYNNSTGYVTLTGYIRTERVPHSGYASLYNSAGPLPNEFALEYDHRWHKRENNVIGPFDNVRPTPPSGLRIYDSGLTAIGIFDSVFENDVNVQWRRKGDRTFTTTILEDRDYYYPNTGFLDSSSRRQGKYLYTIYVVDDEGNVYSSGAYLNIGAVRTPFIINSNKASNVSNTVARGILGSGATRSFVPQNIANDIIELDNSIYTYIESSGGSVIDAGGRIYDVGPATGNYLTSGTTQFVGSKWF